MSKVWIVTLSKRNQHDVKIVRARTKEGAVRTAKLNSFMKGVHTASHHVRVADPVRDLGCVKL